MYEKILITSNFHHKNQQSLIKILNFLGYTYQISSDPQLINQYDLIYSPCNYIDPSKYPNKKFILGPHWEVNPQKVLKINNIYQNAIYIQPSDWVINNFWSNVKNIPLRSFCFSVDTDKFVPLEPIQNRNQIFVYYKHRHPNDLKQITNYLNQRQIDYVVINYSDKYLEKYYLDILQNSKYGIWVGSHESQGFALEEALACDIPLLVWNVDNLNQEYIRRKYKFNVKATTIPYWDHRCGEYFYSIDRLDQTFNKFIKQLETYQPRQYILDNLTVEIRASKFKKMIEDSFEFH